MDLEFSYGLMDQNTKETGKIIFKKEPENLLILMVKSIRDNGTMDVQTGMANTLMQMVLFMRVRYSIN